MIKQADHAQRLLNQLRAADINLAMDDFGTGYSSLSYIRNIPFTAIKIDQSFIFDITVDTKDTELVQAAIAMGKGLNLKVVAEGVETEEQFAILKQLNCDIAQGYLFSKPIPADKFTKYLANPHRL